MHRNQFGLTLSLLLGAYVNVAAAAAPPFAAPSGFEGAGLGLGDQKGRVWAETAFHTQEYFTVAAATLGAGYRVTDSLELEAMLPFSYISVESFDLGGYGARTEREHGFGIGNPYLGISRVHLDGTLRYKAGLGVTLPIAADEYPAGTAVVLAPATYGWQNAHLWAPDVLSIAAPLRVEGGDAVVLSVDATPVVMIVTNDDLSRDRDTDFLLQVAPGAGVYATDTLLVGARLPIFWAVTGDSYNDHAQVAVEPYARLDVGSGFLNARFTVNLDEPLGFAFDESKVWGAHLGGGLVF